MLTIKTNSQNIYHPTWHATGGEGNKFHLVNNIPLPPYLQSGDKHINVSNTGAMFKKEAVPPKKVHT